MDFKHLLIAIADKVFQKEGLYPGKTRLIKLCYLAEVFFYRLTKRRMTNAKWVFWKYGPYVFEYPDILSSKDFKQTDPEDDFTPIEPETKTIPPLNFHEDIAIAKAIQFAGMDLNELLDFVYFDTEPMITAKVRGEELDFSVIQPEDYYRIQKLAISPEQSREIRKKIRDWKQKRASRCE